MKEYNTWRKFLAWVGFVSLLLMTVAGYLIFTGALIIKVIYV